MKLWRINPAYWWELLDSRTRAHVRFHAIRAALNPRLSDQAVEAMYNVFYFQYSIDQAKQAGRKDAADYVEAELRYVSAEEALESLRRSADRVIEYQDAAYKNQTALYFPSSRRAG